MIGNTVDGYKILQDVADESEGWGADGLTLSNNSELVHHDHGGKPFYDLSKT